MTDTYNGWVNRETWCAALHLSNDQHLYSLCEQLAVEALVEADQSEWVQNESIPRDRMAAYNMADALKEMAETWAESVRLAAVGAHRPVGLLKEAVEMVMDVGSLYRVEWADVARDYIATAIENEGDK